MVASGRRKQDRAAPRQPARCDAEPRQALRSLRAASIGFELIVRAGRPTGMPAAIEVRDVHKRFGELQALSGIDLEIPQGEFFGLLGPNGAGKTTLISVLAGLARADRGTARVMGHDVRADYRAARRSLGVVPQELVFDPFFTVRETLRIQSGYFGMRDNGAWIEEVMQHLDLASKSEVNMRTLSGGQGRKGETRGDLQTAILVEPPEHVR